MPRTDRNAALNVAWTALWWLLDPDHNRWGKVHEVLADPTSRLTIEAGSRDETGRRSSGTHSDPTGAAALAVLDVGLDLRRQQRALRRDEADIAETAHWIRATIAGEDHEAPPTLPEAVWSIQWASTVPHTAAAWRADTDEQRDEMDHACDHLARECAMLAAKVRILLAKSVREKPKVQQPKRRDCRAHTRAGKLDVLAIRNGLCEECAEFRRLHGCDPHEPIIRAWDWGRKRLTPALIAEAKAEHASRRKGRKAG